jgi:hypothetical protein
MTAAPKRRGAGELPGLALLSFVDLVFATTAVLLVAFVLNRIEQQQAQAVAAPLRPHLLLCNGEGHVAWHRAGDAAPRPVPPQSFAWLLDQLAQEGGPPPRMVFAFGAACFTQYWQLMAEIERADRRAANGERTPPPVVTPIPLAAGPAVEEALVARWREQASESTR